MSQALKIGIDVGHGAVKSAWIGPDGELRRDHFPSHVAYSDQDLLLTDPALVAGFHIEFEGQAYMTGKLAACTSEDRLLRKRNDSNVDDPAWNALIRTALGRVIADLGYTPERVILVSGLPVQYYNNENARRKLIEAVHRIDRFVLGQNREIEVQCEAWCLPQGYAAYLDECFDTEGLPKKDAENFVGESFGTVDIGERTTDLVCIQEKSYVRHKTGSIHLGMRDVARQMCDEIHQELGIRIPINRRTQMLRRDGDKAILHARGTTFDVTEIAERAKESVARRLLDYIEGEWCLEEISHLVITGGGSLHLADALRNVSAGLLDHVHASSGGVFANANGYAKFAAMVEIAESDEAANDSIQEAA